MIVCREYAEEIGIGLYSRIPASDKFNEPGIKSDFVLEHADLVVLRDQVGFQRLVWNMSIATSEKPGMTLKNTRAPMIRIQLKNNMWRITNLSFLLRNNNAGRSERTLWPSGHGLKMCMNEHKNMTILLLVVLSVSAAYLWHYRIITLKTATRIVYVDRNTVPMRVWAESSNRIGTLSSNGRIYHMKVYAANGKTAWQDEVCTASSDIGILVSKSGNESQYINNIGEATRQPNIVCLSVNGHQVASRWLSIRPTYSIRVANVLVQGNNVYVVGEADISDPTTDHSYPTIIKSDKQGRLIWAKIERRIESGYFAKVVADRKGNIVVAGTIGSAMGTCMAKYTASGQQLWSKNPIIKDSDGTAWVGIRRTGNIAAIVELFSDDYVLATYNGSGKLISQQRLTDAPNIDVEDAALNNRDELYVLCSEGYSAQALLIKYDARGKRIWSGAINMPAKCTAYQIVPSNKGAYIYGCWSPCHDGPENSIVHGEPRIKAFIYRIAE